MPPLVVAPDVAAVGGPLIQPWSPSASLLTFRILGGWRWTGYSPACAPGSAANPAVRRKSNSAVNLGQRQRAAEGGEGQIGGVAGFGEEPAVGVAGVVLDQHLVLRDEDVFTQRGELAVVGELRSAVIRFGRGRQDFEDHRWG